MAADETITCQHCGKEQKANRSVCWNCGKHLSDDADPKELPLAISAAPRSSPTPPAPRTSPPKSSGGSGSGGTVGGGIGMMILFVIAQMACRRSGACVEQDFAMDYGGERHAKCSQDIAMFDSCKGTFYPEKSCTDVMTSMGYHQEP